MKVKRIFFTLVVVAAAVFASCSKEDGSEVVNNDATFEAIAKTFLNRTVYPTYAALADGTDKLVADLTALKVAKTQQNLENVCITFKDARAMWEMSEAFLFGAATDFGIDPHIDSWPLDEDAFNDLMSSPEILKNLEGEDGSGYAGNKLGNELLGFHGIEFILFEDGRAKDVVKITADEMTYAIAVAGDLRNRTAQLDVAWRGNAAPAARVALVENLELQTTVSGGDYSYGENLLNAGKAGSTFRSWVHAMQSILQACSDIADEVGTGKIGKAHTGEDVSYIESPYSHNSISDFYDNIQSVENVYYGGMVGNRDEANSLHAYFRDNNAEVDSKMTAAIADAKEKIQSMKAPFVKFFTDSSAQDAMDACAALDECIGEAAGALAMQ